MGSQALSGLALVVVVGFVLSSAGGSLSPRAGLSFDTQPTGGSASVSIDAVSNFGYVPDTVGNLPLSATITVTFTDEDVLPHTFNISSREGFQIPNNYTADQLNRLFSEYPALYATSVGYQGDVSVGNFTSPSTPGWYEFVCNESGHFTEGMYGFIAFGEPVPSNLTPPHHGSEIPTTGSPIVAVVGGLLIVGILAGVLIWRRRRARLRYASNATERTDGTAPSGRPGRPPREPSP